MSMARSTEISGFLDGREYTASFLYEFCALLVGNGVYADELAPTANNDNMTVTYGSGHAWINGVLYKNTTPFDMDFDTADGALDRYDSIMLRLDLSQNEAYAVVEKGAFAASPTPPEVTRNAEIFDLKICDVYIPAGCTKITQYQVFDTRLDSAVCGVPVFLIEHLDTTSFYRQIATDLANFKSKEQMDFSEWEEAQKSVILNTLERLNGLISEDTVGSLINQINERVTKTGDTMTGPLDMGSNRVKNVADPEEDADAVNKRYADKFLLKGEAATSANKLNIDAGSATNPVYFADGVPVKTTHTLESSVPADAKFTDTVYVHPAYTERTGVPTANATPAFGGTFKVSQPVTDDTGHVTAINSRTVTIPSTTATASAAGLMSASDYSKLNTLCPKMAVGTEYKTGEYYAGYAVYAKIVNGGALPNNTYTTVSTGITNGMHLVSIDVCFGSGGTFQNIMPVEQNASGYSVKIRQAAITRVILQTGGDETGSTCYILLKYTKTTG